MSVRSVLLEGCDAWGLALTPEALERFEAYERFLARQNAVMDLTAVTGPEETARRHFLDSLSLLRLGDFPGKRVIDVGTGAGFPGLPLLIAVPEMELTLLDAQQKRVDFLSALCEKLDLRCRCVHGRAEEFIAEAGEREGYDAAVSRAVARLNQLSELCLPFVRVGGAFYAMKARNSDDELREAASALNTLGGTLESTADFDLGEVPRRVAVIRKETPTPAKYPRRFAKISKKPL